MTIREYLKRRWWATWNSAICLVLGLFAAQRYGPPTLTFDIGLRVIGGCAFASLIWNLYRTPCPNCHQPMRGMALQILGSKYALSSPHCRHCDTNIDRDLPG